MTNQKITNLLFVYNEENRIRYYLEAMKNFCPLVVIDNFSEDNTVSIVKEYTNAVFQYKNPGTGDDPDTLTFAMSHVSTEWVYGGRADELLPLSLQQKLDEIVKADSCDIVRIPRLNLLFGHHSKTWGPDYQPLLFKQDALDDYTKNALFEITYKKEARIFTLPDTPEMSIWHFSNYDVSSYTNTNNRYSSMSAKNVMKLRALSKANFSHSLEPMKVVGKKAIGRLQLSKRLTLLRILFSPGLRFFWHYFIRGGIKSGWSGFVTSYLMMMEQMLTELKIWELENNISKEKIDAYYNKLKTEIIAGKVPQLKKEPFK